MTVYHSLSHLRRDCEYHVAFLRSEGKSGFSECCVDSCGRYREAPGIEDCRRAPDGASRAYVCEYSAEVCGGECDRMHQGEECYSDSQDVWWSTAQFHCGNFWARVYFVSTVGLGENMFRAYIRKPRGRGRAVRADEVWNLHSPPGRLMLLWRL
jgi:putative transposase